MSRFDIALDSRGYELDADGLVPAHVLLRYMEHLRWEYAIRDLPELAALYRDGHTFVVVAQTLRVARDIGMAIPIQGTLWIGRTGRTSIVFRHAFHRVDDGELVAAGNTTAVYPDCLRHQDADPFMMPDPDPPRFTEIRSPLFEYSCHVRHSDLDLLEHMNQANYAALIDDARQAAAGQNAYGPGGLGLGRIRLLHIEYLRPALSGEKLVTTTWALGRDALNLGFAMWRDKTLISRAVIQIQSRDAAFAKVGVLEQSQK
jgi:acyl-CoA thioesterase FadM